MDESHTEKSGWFTGGAIFSKTEDLEGKLTKTASNANLNATNILLNSKNDLTMVGVDVTVITITITPL